MDKKDFLLPGIVLGLVIITALGVLITHTDPPKLIPTESAATSTESVATAPVSGSTSNSAQPAPGHSAPAPVAHAPSAYYPYGTIVLALNQAAIFKDGVSIRPTNLVEDSRCPSDVQCIQAGTVKVSLKTDSAGVEKTQEIQLGHSVTVGDDTITLESVSPERSTTAKFGLSAYRFTFKVTHGGMSTRPCYVGGCSAQLCTDAPGAISTCIYTASYACYRTATCERQSNGSCGWTQTAELKACLANAS